MASANHFTLSDGSTMYYECYGHGEPLVLLHGNGGSIDYFKNQIKVFQRYYKVYALDLRGRGHSTDQSDTISFDLMAKDLLEWIHYEHLSKIHLLGFSDGANLALIFAQQHPQYIQSLILNAANGAFSDLTLSAKCRFKVSDILMRLSSHFHNHAQKMHHYFQLAFANLHLDVQKLKALNVPVLILVGEYDIVKHSFSKRLASIFKHATLCIAPHVGHGFAIENATAYNKCVLHFLQQQPHM